MLSETDCSLTPHNLGQYISAQIHTSEVLSPHKGSPAVTGLSTRQQQIMTAATTSGVTQSDSQRTILPTDTKRTDKRFCSWIDEDDLTNCASYRCENCRVDRHGDQGIREGGLNGVRREREMEEGW